MGWYTILEDVCSHIISLVSFGDNIPYIASATILIWMNDAPMRHMIKSQCIGDTLCKQWSGAHVNDHDVVHRF
jgi:hypothetical protein